jgi:hypothetical protein
MKHTIAILSLALAVTVATFAQAAPAQHLGKQQLNTLIATAKTPADHLRIAAYFEASAQSDRNQAQEHQAMIAAFRANTSLSNDKNRPSTIGHCEYFVKTLNARAAKSDEQAKLHQQMAQQSGQM